MGPLTNGVFLAVNGTAPGDPGLVVSRDMENAGVEDLGSKYMVGN